MPNSPDAPPEETGSLPARAPTLYVTDLTYDRFDPADLFDLAFLLRSSRHDLRGICLTRPDGEGERVIDLLALLAGTRTSTFVGESGLQMALEQSPMPVNLVVVGGYETVVSLLASDKPLFREKVARIFLIGGLVNDYTPGSRVERLPIDPRLQERNPERFVAHSLDRMPDSAARLAFSQLLVSGEGIIFLPRDICLWRYAAPQILTEGGALCEFLLRELFYVHLSAGGDRYEAAEQPVLLSSLPGLLLATEPDPFAWMRLFRVIPAFVGVNEGGAIDRFETTTDSPNLYTVIAIDGQALGQRLTQTLRSPR